jgi:hypothetical protein
MENTKTEPQKPNTAHVLMRCPLTGGTPWFRFYGAAVVNEIRKSGDRQERADPDYQAQVRAEVKAAIAEGSIKIGTPPNRVGAVLVLKDGRWHYHKIRSIRIDGRIWKSPKTGNTWHVARVFLNGRQVWISPIHLNGGYQFETTALRWLRDSGHLPESDHPWTGVPNSVIRRVFEYTCEPAQRVSRRKDLPKPQNAGGAS